MRAREGRSTWRQKILARRVFADALATEPDVSVLQTKPSGRFAFGLVLIACSYVIAWPSMALLSAIAISLGHPGWAAVGSTALYALSHAVFAIGMWCAGTGSTKTMQALAHLGLRWVARRFLLP